MTALVRIDIIANTERVELIRQNNTYQNDSKGKQIKMSNLPFEFRKATATNPRFLALYGAPKVGKTPACLALKNSLLLDLEDRARFFDGSYETIINLQHLEQVGNKIKEFGKPYKYGIIDTGTVLNTWTDEFAKLLYLASPICNKELKKNPQLLQSVTDLPNMAGWNWTRIAYSKWLNYIRDLFEVTIMILHVRDKFLSDTHGNSVQSSDVSLTGKLKEITLSRADAIGYLYRVNIGAENGKSISQMRINFNAGNEIVAGSTCKHLRGQDFEFDPENNPSDWDKIFLPE